MKKISYVNLSAQSFNERIEALKIFKKIFLSGDFILGEQVEKFEKKICNYLKVNECVALNSGTDALTLGLHLLGVKKGDEVITPPNSFIASTASIAHLGAIPIFADIKDDLNIDPLEIEKKITKKTKAIMPVHLSGHPCEMDKIMKISKKYKIPVIEDAAQAIGTKYNNKFVGTFGDIGCFSAHPLKNLNAIGDSGYLITNNKKYANKIRLLRNHGIKNRNTISFFGYVSRMDSIQASILNLRFQKLHQVIKKRRNNAKLYFENLKDLKNLELPFEKKNEFNTYHTFVIKTKNRNKLKKFLEDKGIQTAIHYPYLIFEQKAFKDRYKYNYKSELKNSKKFKNLILTLPINQYLKKKQIVNICKNIIKFYK
jgi:dTDP-4-amino-4,6-dideoxygalactose transaminase